MRPPEPVWHGFPNRAVCDGQVRASATIDENATTGDSGRVSGDRLFAVTTFESSFQVPLPCSSAELFVIVQPTILSEPPEPNNAATGPARNVVEIVLSVIETVAPGPTCSPPPLPPSPNFPR